MKKLFKKATSVFVAAVMAASMVVSAGADDLPSGTWRVTYTPAAGAPSNITITDIDVKTAITTTNLTKITSRCTSFSSTEDPYGSLAYVTYKCQILDNDNYTVRGTTASRYHYQVSNPSSGTTTTLPVTFEYGDYAKITYTLKQEHNYPVKADISGTYSFSK